MTIGVTGASGGVGSRVVAHVLAANHPPVVALGRRVGAGRPFELVSADVSRLTGEPQQPYAEFIRSAVLAPAI